MKTLIAITDPGLIDNLFDAHTLARLRDNTDLVWAPQDGSFTQEAFAANINQFDACITSWDSPKLMGEAARAATRLRFVGHAAGTVAPYVAPELIERGVAVVSSSEQLARSTAECAMALLMAGAWRFRHYDEGMRTGRWSQSRRETVMGVFNQRIGLIGLGQVTRQLIEFLRPYRPQLLLCSAHCSAQQARELGVEPVPLGELMANAQIVSLHATLTTKTRHMIGAAELARVSDGALIVNTARAGLIDSAALLAELRSGRLNAALDVFEHEPLEPSDPLLHLPNVLCTPHIGGISSHWRKQIGSNIVNALELVRHGQIPANAITAERLAAMSSN